MLAAVAAQPHARAPAAASPAWPSSSAIGEIEVDLDQAKRLELPVAAESPDGRSVAVDSQALRDWASRLLSFLRQIFERPVAVPGVRAGGRGPGPSAGPAGPDPRRPAQGRVRRDQRSGSWSTTASPNPTGPGSTCPALGLLAKLDPSRTVPARINARLTQGSGRLPSWIRPDWFDDGRIEPVMAAPRFHYPMYEPLDRYEREWLIPGLGHDPPARHGHPAGDQQRLHRGVPGRPQPRDGPRTAVAGVSDRPARHLLRLVLDRQARDRGRPARGPVAHRRPSAITWRPISTRRSSSWSAAT